MLRNFHQNATASTFLQGTMAVIRKNH